MIHKFINDPDNLTSELLEGYVMAYSDQVAIGGENIIVRAACQVGGQSSHNYSGRFRP